MIDGWLFSLTLVAALGSGVVAGVFFAFSTFVMKALGHLSPPIGMAAMQSINVAAPGNDRELRIVEPLGPVDRFAVSQVGRALGPDHVSWHPAQGRSGSEGRPAP